ncbi:MAG: hypothetical protein WA071_00680 [Undibacterium umbellatum]|uniref:HORMA-1 domain-containing protein n=1 Tax=Undibacterium umbellatum TaxID=2762300 RepID=UPI003BB7B644
MSYSLTITESGTFTITHARHLAAKVAADLKRIQRFYEFPSDEHIANLEGEATELLRQGYLESVIYGFQRNGGWIDPTLRYTVKDLADGSVNDDPGRIKPGADVCGATFHSFLSYSSAWFRLSEEEKKKIETNLPIQRTFATEPQVIGGYFVDDKIYSSGTRSLGRASIRSY